MKKLFGLAVTAIALGSLLVSCASSGAAKSAGDAPAIPHPRTYVLDPADATTSLDLVYNSYGPNYQATVDMWKFMKKDKPQAGDTMQIRAKVTSDTDIPNVVFYLTDTSPAANYWTNLCGDNYILDMKAGEAYDINVDVTLDTGTKGGMVITFAYDGGDHGQENAEKVGKAAKFTFEKVADTTDTNAEVPSKPHQTNVTIDLSKYAAFCQIETNHPWVDGVQDMSVIANYQTTPEVTGAYGDDLPKAGDTIHLVWKASSDIDIEKIYVRPVDCSSAANWWKELTTPDWEAQDETMTLVENVQAGVPFECEKDIVLTEDAVAQVNICLWYEVGQGDGPAIIKLVRD